MDEGSGEREETLRGQGPRSERTFSLGPGASRATLIHRLREDFPIKRLPRTSCRLSDLDTFDGRIRAAGMRLHVREDGGSSQLILEHAADGRRLSTGIQKVPAFASDLPPGPLERELHKLAKLRRLAPLVHIEQSTSGYAILDDERKTVARVFFEAATVRDPTSPQRALDLPTTLRVRRIEGYARKYARVLECLTRRPGLTPIDGELSDRALQAIGRPPPQRRSGLDAPLDKEAPAGHAFVTIQGGLLSVMRSNEPGIVADLDTEYLHDFRVAVRRSRVLHRLFRDELENSGWEALLPELKWLGRVTGRTRDLDVHLIELEKQKRAAGSRGESLAPLIAMLREERQDAWSELQAALTSDRYLEFVASANALLQASDSEAAGRIATSGPPLAEWASDRIARAHHRLLKHGRRIAIDSPDARLHELRIDAKKLRYLMEFFRGLYAKEPIKKLIKELQRLQDNLGAFNDSCVQRDTLHALAHDLDRRGLGAPDTLLAIGGLIERAERRRDKERERFEDRFARFDASETRRRFRQLFAGRRNARKFEPATIASGEDAPRSDGEGAEEES